MVLTKIDVLLSRENALKSLSLMLILGLNPIKCVKND
jgi:hypothetical protein